MPFESSRGEQGVQKSSRRSSLRWLLILFVLLLLAIGGYYYFFLSRPMGSGPAGPQVSQSFPRHDWTSRPVLLVGLGDSVTAGFGARKGYSYFDRLVSNPTDEFPEMRDFCLSTVLRNLTFTNLAVSGSISFEHVEKQLPRLPKADTNTIGLIVITTGGNDLIHNYGRTSPTARAMYGATMEQARPWIAAFNDRLETMLARIDESFPGGYQVYLADIYDPTDGIGDIERAGLPAWKDGMEILRAYNEVIHNFVQRHEQVNLVPLHDTFLGHGLHCTQFWADHYDVGDPHYWYFVNLEDPNERGYDVIRRLFLNAIETAADKIK